MPDGSLILKVFDGTRAPLPQPDVLVSLWDGYQRQVHWNYHKASEVRFIVPLANNFGDTYRVVVGADGYRYAGQSAIRLGAAPAEIELMLLPKKSKLQFDPLATLQDRVRNLLKNYMLARPQYAAADEAAYQALQIDSGPGLATLLNISSAFDGFNPHPLDFIEELLSLEPDRFFAHAKAEFIGFLEQEKQEGTFESASASLHPGADTSYKENRYPEANVQFTLTRKGMPNGTVKVDADIDYYADPGSHFLLEIFPSDIIPAILGTSKRLTDSRVAYALRWMAVRRRFNTSNISFDPPYRITA